MAVVLTLLQTEQVRISIQKRNNTENTVRTIQKIVNIGTHITKTSTHYKTHTYTYLLITKQAKITRVQVNANIIQDIRK